MYIAIAVSGIPYSHCSDRWLDLITTLHRVGTALRYL